MKIAAILLVLLNAALLVPAVDPYRQYLIVASIGVALASLVAVFVPKPSVPAPKPVVAEAVKPAAAVAAVAPQNQAQAEVVTLLGIFQEKGRFIDFLMEDIAPYSDADVGSVARAVHLGCKAALNDHFRIEAICPEGEGASVTIPAGYAADEVRLVGNLSGEAPFTGKIVHKGWRTSSVKLPRLLNADKSRLPVIAAAQVEVV